jgi:hypothetical protein
MTTAYDPTYVLIPGTKTLLHIDIDVERKRVELFTPVLRQFGRVFDHRPYRGEYRTMDPVGRCFDQAMRHAKKYGLTYVEGFMVFEGEGIRTPIGHGWCIDREGIVVDPTSWRYTGSPRVAYAGVPIRIDYHDKWKAYTGYYGVMDGYFDGRVVHTNVGIYADPVEDWLQSIAK